MKSDMSSRQNFSRDSLEFVNGLIMNVTTICASFHPGHMFSRMQVGWQGILRYFIKLCRRTRILPIGFTISFSNNMVLIMNPTKILVNLVTKLTRIFLAVLK